MASSCPADRRDLSGSKTLFVSEDQGPTLAHEALSSGVCAREYVVKSDACSDLLPTLEAVLQDRQFMSLRFQKTGGLPDA